MDYKVLDMEKYYRKDIYRHFTMECKCSIMITSSGPEVVYLILFILPPDSLHAFP